MLWSASGAVAVCDCVVKYDNSATQHQIDWLACVFCFYCACYLQFLFFIVLFAMQNTRLIYVLLV